MGSHQRQLGCDCDCAPVQGNLRAGRDGPIPLRIILPVQNIIGNIDQSLGLVIIAVQAGFVGLLKHEFQW